MELLILSTRMPSIKLKYSYLIVYAKKTKIEILDLKIHVQCSANKYGG